MSHPPLRPQSSQPVYLRVASSAIPLFLCLALVGACLIISPVKRLWYDEVLTVYPANLPALAQVIPVCQQPMNIAPPLYFLLAWVVAHTVGASPLALRLLSCLPLCASVLLLGRLLRHSLSLTGIALGLLGLTAASVIVYQSAEARFYGLYFFFAALLFGVFVHLNTQQHPTPPTEPAAPPALRSGWRAGGLVLGATLLLLFTHTLGLFFLVALLLCQVLIDLNAWRSRGGRGGSGMVRSGFWGALRLEVYGGAALGLLIFAALWMPTAITQQRSFHGQSPAGPLSLQLLARMMLDEAVLPKVSYGLPFVFVVGVVIARFNRVRSFFTGGTADTPSVSLLTPRHILLLFALGYQITAPFLLCMASRVGTSLMLERYFMPHWIGWAVMVAWGVDYALRQRKAGGAVNLAQKPVFAACLVLALLYVLQFVTQTRWLVRDGRSAATNDALLAAAMQASPQTQATDKTLPTVYSSAFTFTPALVYHPENHPLFLRDMVDGKNLGVAFVNLTALKANFPSVPIISMRELEQYNDFMVYDVVWLEYGKRFARDPRYTVTEICQALQYDGEGKAQPMATVYVYRVHRVR